MNDIFAGVICGFIMGLVFVGTGAIMLPYYRSELEASFKGFSSKFLRSVLAVSAVFVTVVVWSLIGLGAAWLYRWTAINFPVSGPGTPNLPFTAGVIIIALAATVLLLLTQRKGVWERLIMNGAFVVVLGWLLPILAR